MRSLPSAHRKDGARIRAEKQMNVAQAIRTAVQVAALLGATASIAADPPDWAQSGRPPPAREFLQPMLDADLAAYRSCGVRGRLEGAAPPIVVDLAGRWVRAFHE